MSMKKLIKLFKEFSFTDIVKWYKKLENTNVVDP